MDRLLLLLLAKLGGLAFPFCRQFVPDVRNFLSNKLRGGGKGFLHIDGNAIIGKKKQKK